MTHPSLTGLSLKLTPENLKKGDSKPHETECSLPVMTLTLLDTHLIKLPSINGNNICRQEKKNPKPPLQIFKLYKCNDVFC